MIRMRLVLQYDFYVDGFPVITDVAMLSAEYAVSLGSWLVFAQKFCSEGIGFDITMLKVFFTLDRFH